MAIKSAPMQPASLAAAIVWCQTSPAGDDAIMESSALLSQQTNSQITIMSSCPFQAGGYMAFLYSMLHAMRSCDRPPAGLAQKLWRPLHERRAMGCFISHDPPGIADFDSS